MLYLQKRSMRRNWIFLTFHFIHINIRFEIRGVCRDRIDIAVYEIFPIKLEINSDVAALIVIDKASRNVKRCWFTDDKSQFVRVQIDRKTKF